MNTLSVSLKGRVIGVVLCGLLCHTAQAGGLSGSLNNFFNGLGYNNNVTNPSSYKGQAANYYNGGSLSARTPIVSAQLMSIVLPDVSAGCGGID
ncbi:conjugal transfer protein TraH, partial [Vibrio chagasii]